MSASTLTIAEVETAIRNILLGGSSVSRAGVSLTRADLPALMKLRKDLLADAGRGAFVFDHNVPLPATEY